MSCTGCDGCTLGVETERDFSVPFRQPFMAGVTLALNAIPDAFAVLDGPDCLFFKASHVHGRHDLRSTLLDATGRHRVAVTQLDTTSIATNRGAEVARLVRAVDADERCRVILVSSLPMASIVGVQYDTVLAGLRGDVQAALVEIPGRSLSGDWIRGYESVLEALAGALEVGDDDGTGDGVSVIGHFMDRNEGDHTGNVRELQRLVQALGLQLDSVWFGGQPHTQLTAARRSGTLLALPMGRRAAHALAGRTGARVVEVDTPFGLARTSALLRALGAATGREARAELFIERELRSCVRPLEWAVQEVFEGRRVAFAGAPDLLVGFAELASELGMEIAHLDSPCFRPEWFPEELPDAQPFAPVPRFDLTLNQLLTSWLACLDAGLDLAIGSTDAHRMIPVPGPFLEFGYPSHATHVYVDRPFLGYRGFLAFVQQMADVMGLWRLRRTSAAVFAEQLARRGMIDEED